ICTIEFQIESDNEISYYRLSNDNITWSDWIDYSQYVMWLLSEGYGMKTVYAQVMDEIGLISPVFTDDIELVFIDENPPTTTVRRGNPSYDNYITSSTPIWFDAVDDYSGVNKTYYRIWYNGVWSAWTIYVENFSLDEECKHYIEFYSSDNSENNEAIKNITLYVDNTPPSHNIDVGVPSYTDGINQWINFSTPVYINASDEGPCKVGSYHIHWIIWNSTGGYAYNSNITNTANIILYINEECKHIIGYWVEDNLGNRDPAIGYINTTVYVDNSEPDTIMETGSLSYQYNGTTYIKSTTPIFINASDRGCQDGVGINKITYRIDNGETQVVKNTTQVIVNFTAFEDGVHNIEYWSVDNLGNEEDHHFNAFFVDDTPPETGISISEIEGSNGWYNSNVTIALNATDSGCGVARILYGTNGMQSQEGNFVMFNLTQDGIYIVNYYAEDYLGNVEDAKLNTIKIDKTKSIIHDYTLSQATTRDPLIFNASIEDANGIDEAYVEYWYGNSSHTNESMEKVGNYWQKEIIITNTLETLHYIISAVDEAGNWNTTGERTVDITDNDNPEITSFDVHPDIQTEGGYVNISCTVIDNLYVGKVYVNITYPDLSHHSYEMEKKGNEYYYNTSFVMTGDYSCFIYAMDTSNNSINSSVATFTIVANSSPDVPTNPSPEDGQATVAVTVDLSWVCSDPDNDSLTYDIYFGISSPPSKVASNISSAMYNPGTLDYGTTYYWRVVAWDEHGAKTPGPTWSFTTKANSPPARPTLSGPSSGYTGSSLGFSASSTDPDGDRIKYGFDWNNDDTVDEWTSLYNSGVTASKSHSWSSAGSYSIKVIAEDEHGLQSEWSTVKTVTVT
ncbi:MAG: hypothetical protein DRN07_08675, partial [Thermoplasmata archaeon]